MILLSFEIDHTLLFTQIREYKYCFFSKSYCVFKGKEKAHRYVCAIIDMKKGFNLPTPFGPNSYFKPI